MSAPEQCYQDSNPNMQDVSQICTYVLDSTGYAGRVGVYRIATRVAAILKDKISEHCLLTYILSQ